MMKWVALANRRAEKTQGRFPYGLSKTNPNCHGGWGLIKEITLSY